MELEVFDATEVSDGSSCGVASLPRRHVVVGSAWTVADVLEAGGHDRYQSFNIVSSRLELDVNADPESTIWAAHNLLGIDDRGVVYFQSGTHVRWNHFVRAADAHLYVGDPTRLVVYRGGVAGGPSPDGLWESVQWLFDNRDLAVSVAEDVMKVAGSVASLEAGRRWMGNARKRQIAQRWRKQGFTSARIADYLHRLPQWDESEFAKQMRLTAQEARVALTRAGYEQSQDGLWRLGTSELASAAQERLTLIQEQATNEGKDGW